VPFSAGLRSYRNAWLNWRTMPFGLMVLLQSFYLTEISRYEYLKGYFSGWLFPTDAQRLGRQKLRDTI
jgi:hypothetical protein